MQMRFDAGGLTVNTSVGSFSLTILHAYIYRVHCTSFRVQASNTDPKHKPPEHKSHKKYIYALLPSRLINLLVNPLLG